jgi:hypothetical protein
MTVVLTHHSFSSVVVDQQPTWKYSKQTSLAERNPPAFFDELKRRLLTHQIEQHDSTQIRHRTIDDDSFAVLDRQIAKTIDDADQCLSDSSRKRLGKSVTRSDSGLGIDSTEQIIIRPNPLLRSIEVVWYPSLNSSHALLSTITCHGHSLTFREFRQVFKQQSSHRYA